MVDDAAATTDAARKFLRDTLLRDKVVFVMTCKPFFGTNIMTSVTTDSIDDGLAEYKTPRFVVEYP
jgi:hypothetical protein